MTRRTAPLLAAAVLGLAALPGHAQAPYRERFPGPPIDPAKGVDGDIGFSDTLRYWRTPQALERHAEWAADPAQQWKLNWKHMDLDRVDLHPGHLAVDEGEAMVAALAARSPAFLPCLAAGAASLAAGAASLDGQAATYPRHDAALQRVVTVEGRIERCAQAAGEKMPQGSAANNKVAVYFKSRSAGAPIRVDIGDAKVMEAYRRGEEAFHARTGQLNFACASCHVPGSIMGHKLRGETPTTPFGDAAHYPTYRTPVNALESIQERFARCHSQMRTQPLRPGDPVYDDLEVFMTVLSNGYPVSVPSAR